MAYTSFFRKPAELQLKLLKKLCPCVCAREPLYEIVFYSICRHDSNLENSENITTLALAFQCPLEKRRMCYVKRKRKCASDFETKYIFDKFYIIECGVDVALLLKLRMTLKSFLVKS